MKEVNDEAVSMQDNRRYYSLDALRGSMMMLGIVLHGSQFYVSEPMGGIPMPADPSNSYLFNIILYFIHSFRMPLFFVLAGFFTSLLVDKRGVKGTYVNRGKRILGPLLVGVVTILPLTMVCMGAFLVSAKFNTFQFIPEMAQIEIIAAELQEAGFPVDEPSLGHLWFLYYLLYFYLTIPLCILIVRLAKPYQSSIDKWLARPSSLLALGLLTSLTLWPFKYGQVFEGFIFITPHLPSLAYYGMFFIAGYIFHHHRSILDTFKQHFPRLAVFTLILFPVSLYFSVLEESTVNPGALLHVMAVISGGLCTWTLIYSFMGIFLRYLDYESPWILYISQSSYWVYLIHMPLVSFFAWCMLPFELSAFIKFPSIVMLTALFSLFSYHYWVQKTWVSDLLNGMRFDLKWPWNSHEKELPRSG